MRFKTPPLKQGAVANELRRRIMIAVRDSEDPSRSAHVDGRRQRLSLHHPLAGRGHLRRSRRHPRRSAALPRWWPSVYLDVEELEPADARGLGRRVRLLTKGWLPYTLAWEFVVTEIPLSARFRDRGDRRLRRHGRLDVRAGRARSSTSSTTGASPPRSRCCGPVVPAAGRSSKRIIAGRWRKARPA